MRFDDIIGNAPGQIPSGATILSARLELWTTTSGDGAALHRVLGSWSDDDSWNSLGRGVTADDVEAAKQADLLTGFVSVGQTSLDVTSSVQAWADGQANNGWVLMPSGPDAWQFYSAEGSVPPKLIVEYSVPASVTDSPVAGDNSATEVQGDTVNIEVLANDGDTLMMTALAQSDDGTATLDPDTEIVGGDSYTYHSSDGDLESEPATVTVAVTADNLPPTGGVVTFQQGIGGYAGVIDTYLHESSPDKVRMSAKTLIVDGVDKGGEVQVLLRFDGIFGSDAGRIPFGATIISATLTLSTTSKGDGATIHRMVTGWSDADTWNSLGDGVQADGAQAMAQADLITGFVPAGTTTLDLTASVQAWANGQPNLGWVFLPLGPDGWKFDSAEGAVAPLLTVEYSFDGEPTNNPPVAVDDSATTVQGSAVIIDVLANDSDADGDPMTAVLVSGVAHGTLSLAAANRPSSIA